MSESLNKLFEPHLKVSFALLYLFSLLTVWKAPFLGLAELAATTLLLIFILVTRHRRKHRADAVIAEAIQDLSRAGKNSLLDSPFPMVVFRPESGEVIWSNDRFLEVTGRREHLADVRITSAVPEFDARWLLNGETQSPVEYTVHGRRYLVFGSLTARTGEERNPLATTYWIDITDLADIRERFYATRPLVFIIVIDNYEELIRNISDSDRSTIRAAVERQLNLWTDGCNGFLCRYDRDRYLFLMEEQYLDGMKQNKFSVLDMVHNVVSPNGISASLSIGIGRDGSFDEMFRYAALAMEMALSRGGDQVVIKNRFDFEFHGGRSKEQERRTKVKSRVMANALEELILSSPLIYVMGHRHADLDAVGAAVGVAAIARKKGVEVHIIQEDKVVPGTVMTKVLEKDKDYETLFVSPEEAISRVNEETLLVVVDTNRPDQVISQPLLNACRKVAVIDHHRRAADYISNAVLNYHEPYASSASELVTELIQYSIDPSDLKRVEAEALLAGIVLDTKNFTLRTGGRTFEAAAFLRRCGADTTEVRKLFQNDLNRTILRYEVLKDATFVHEGVAVASCLQSVDRIVAAQAADELLNVQGVEASFVVFADDECVNISGRSSGEINVQVILETLGGGGNGNAAGAQLRDTSVKETLRRLNAAISAYFNETEEG
ncbi:MAG: DHH family phosphoesterase [Clostridiales bacterium]|nr:DHH family phosphoesterase [Clostridiales bacterium]